MFDVKPVTSPKENDCGATCLKMLLAYHDIDLPLEQLVKECNTKFIGCTGLDIMRTARLHGLGDIKAYKMDAAELVEQDRPAIIHWKHAHWCVFCGKGDDGEPVICNPDRGRYRVKYGSFKIFYGGVAIFNGEPHDIDSDLDEEVEE